MTRRKVLYITAVVTVGVIAAIAVTAILVSAVRSTQVRDTQETNSPLIENTDKTLKAVEQLAAEIRSCTTPGEPCAERASQQTADAVGSINRVVIAAASCASGPGSHTYVEVQSCVLARLAGEHR